MPLQSGRLRALSGRLRFRVAALLALALLPIGIVGVILTRDLAMEVKNSSDLTLLTMTEHAVLSQRQTLERAIGAGEALGAVLGLIRDDPEACRRDLGKYLDESRRYTFVGFISPSGQMTCSSAETELDLSTDPTLMERMERPRLYVDRLETGRISDRTVINLLQPVYDGASFSGFMSISVPAHSLSAEPDLPVDKRPLSFVIFSDEGQSLAEVAAVAEARVSIPQSDSLLTLVARRTGVFIDRDQNGNRTLFSMVPLIPGAVYAVAAWPRDILGKQSGPLSESTSAFPLIMWGVTLLVAFLAIDRLVGRYVRGLSDQMRSFAVDRRLPRTAITTGAAHELQELESSFVQMAYALMDDEARMEDALREKNVLLKEVHHRVKNNLQLISSIMNMKMRRARTAETTTVLRQLQERILGLSTVHRNLYQTENLSQTNGGLLLRELLNQIVVVGAVPGSNLDVDMTFDDVILFPDQAVPLAMLATELGTNALKHIGAPPGQRPWIRVRFFQAEDGLVHLVFSNSVNAAADPHDEDGSGLGSKLVRAFATQIGAEIETAQTDTDYSVDVAFEVHEFSPHQTDY